MPPKKPAKKAAHGGHFTAAELAAVRRKVGALRASPDGGRVADFARTLEEQTRRLAALEGERAELRAYLKQTRAPRKAKPTPAKRRRAPKRRRAR